MNGMTTSTKDWLGLGLSSEWEAALKANLGRLLPSSEVVMGAYGFKISQSDSRLNPQRKYEVAIVTPSYLLKLCPDNDSCKAIRISTRSVVGLEIETSHYIGPSQHSIGSNFHWEQVKQIRVFLHPGEAVKSDLIGDEIQIPDARDDRPDEIKEAFVIGFAKAFLDAEVHKNQSS